MNSQDFLDSRGQRVRTWFSAETDKLQLSVKSDTPIYDAIALLADPTEACVAVVDDDHVTVGILTERDLLRRLDRHHDIPETLTVGDLMVSDPVTVSPDMFCIEALKIMTERQFRNLPVVEDGKFIGILSVLKAALGRLVETRGSAEDLIKTIQRLDGRSTYLQPTSDLQTTLNEFPEQEFFLLETANNNVDYATRNELTRFLLK